MRTRTGCYKDRRAILVETGRLTAVFLPDDGGKLASLTDRDGKEYLAQAEGRFYRVLSREGRYGAAECSGFDDMFPTIDPYVTREGILCPDHGEICRMSAEVTVEQEAVRFCFRSLLFQTTFRKTVTERNGALQLSYRIENDSDSDFPCLWAAHCMLSGEDDAEIVTPYSADAPIRKMFGDRVESELNRTRLTGYAPDGEAYKFYYTEPIREGICGCRYPSAKKMFLFRYDREEIPYLGLWFNNGSCKGMYSIGLEICTAPYDSPTAAAAAGAEWRIPARGALSFTLLTDLEEIE